MVITPGPFRTASKLGVFITMVVFTDIYDLPDALRDDRTEVGKRVENVCLGGYTFNLDCFLTRHDEGELRLDVRLFLTSGKWDDYLQWPFAKNITVILTHTRDRRKDFRMSIPFTSANATRKPAPGKSNGFGGRTGRVRWQQVELNGFIADNALYFNIEFE